MENQRLWIDAEPDVQDILDQLPDNLDDYDEEIVFCGFGEPTYNLDTLDEVASFLHCIDKKTRINTNGQANLIHKQDVSDVIVTSCDVINISLNECNAKKYQAHCKSIYGEKAFDALALISDSKEPIVPCGVCRQVLREFCDPDAFKVYLIDKGSAYKTVTLSELLPYGFGPDFMK